MPKNRQKIQCPECPICQGMNRNEKVSKKKIVQRILIMASVPLDSILVFFREIAKLILNAVNRRSTCKQDAESFRLVKENRSEQER